MPGECECIRLAVTDSSWMCLCAKQLYFARVALGSVGVPTFTSESLLHGQLSASPQYYVLIAFLFAVSSRANHANSVKPLACASSAMHRYVVQWLANRHSNDGNEVLRVYQQPEANGSGAQTHRLHTVGGDRMMGVRRAEGGYTLYR